MPIWRWLCLWRPSLLNNRYYSSISRRRPAKRWGAAFRLSANRSDAVQTSSASL